MLDRTSKIIFSVIAAALVTIAYNGFSPKPAVALGGSCGSQTYDPCYVQISNTPLRVSGVVEVFNEVSVVAPNALNVRVQD